MVWDNNIVKCIFRCTFYGHTRFHSVPTIFHCVCLQFTNEFKTTDQVFIQFTFVGSVTKFIVIHLLWKLLAIPTMLVHTSTAA